MLTIFEAYLNCLEELHAHMQAAITGLPPEALDWSPGPEMNSLAVLATHVAGSERYWVGEVAGGDPAHRDRPAEFRMHGQDEAGLLAQLETSLAHSRATLAKLTLADLERTHPAGDRGEVSLAWALFHNLEHIGTHLGQMQLTRQLWEEQKG